MNRRRDQHGFATIMAIMLMGFVAVALALLTTSLGAENRRTRQTIDRQQMQQLLFAGARMAQVEIQSNGRIEAGQVPLPGELEQDGAKLAIEPGEISGDTVRARVKARVGRYEISEMVDFKRVGGVWSIVGGELE